MFRILIVDDHPLTRSGLVAELSKTPDISVVGEAGDGDEALRKARKLKPDLVLLDVALPGKSGLEVLKSLKAEFPSVKILMLSGHPESQYAVRCLRNGAGGYLTKDSGPADLIAAIRRVMSGGRFISTSLAELLAGEIASGAGHLPHEKLSDREFQILCLIGQGNTVTQIAGILSLSVSSVNTYRARLLSKMHLSTTAQLIRYVLDNNLCFPSR